MKKPFWGPLLPLLRTPEQPLPVLTTHGSTPHSHFHFPHLYPDSSALYIFNLTLLLPHPNNDSRAPSTSTLIPTLPASMLTPLICCIHFESHASLTSAETSLLPFSLPELPFFHNSTLNNMLSLPQIWLPRFTNHHLTPLLPAPLFKLPCSPQLHSDSPAFPPHSGSPFPPTHFLTPLISLPPVLLPCTPYLTPIPPAVLSSLCHPCSSIST